MFTRIFFSISLGLATLLSCQSPAPDSPAADVNEKSPASRSSTHQEVDEEPDKLSDDNIVEFLKKYGTKNQNSEVLISTSYGEIKIRLYSNTPLHRANMIYLTNKGYFNDTWFYRVSSEHVVQAGNTDGTETIRKRNALGEYTLPAEIVDGNYHKRGAVAMARSYYQNPEKRSDPFEFYIVIGKQYSRRELELLAEKHEMTLSKSQMDFYSSHAGSPHLDGQHSVIGEVVDGMDVVQKISEVEVDEGEWPLRNIPIKVKAL